MTRTTAPSTATRRPRPRRRALLAAGTVLGVVATAAFVMPGTAADGSPAPDLGGRTFVAVETPGRTLVEGTHVRIAFEADRLSARAGCNTLVGPADWSGGVLEAPGLASTMMACAPALQAQDAWLADLLAGSPAIVVDGATLVLGDATTGLVLVELRG